MPADLFIAYLRNEKRYSPHTITSYQTDISQFSGFLKASFEENDITKTRATYVRSWIVVMMDKGVSPVTVNRKITTLKSFFRFMLREGIVTRNPMDKIQHPKTEKKLPEYVSEKDMIKLSDFDVFEEDFEGRRDRLILEMFYSTGLRLSELINLKSDDVDVSACTLKVLGKRNKERIIPFHENLGRLIESYLSDKKGVNKGEAPWFFVTSKGKKLYEKLVYRSVNKYLSKVTTIDKKSPHVLRHTFATHMLNKGADLNAIKELLGHANLSATQVYTHNSIEKLKRIYKQAHPKA